MHMATTTRWWTAADLAELPEDGCRYEALEGELLVTPAPARGHAAVTGRLVAMLAEYCRAQAVGEVLVHGVVRWRSNELQPDLMVSLPLPLDARWDETALPLLVIEIHSPSTHQRDRGVKRAAYMALGIPEYWQVNLEEQCVLVNTPSHDEVLVTRVLEWHPNPDIPPLRIDLHDLFR
jgi:Uma2 family endonuclease